MRSAVVAMLMAGALAAPSAHRAHMRIHQERDAQPNEVIVTATAYTTVMQGAAPTVAPAPAAPEAKVVTVQQPQAPAPAAPAVPAAPSAYKAPAPVQASGPAPSAPAPSAPSSGNTGNLDDYAKKALDTHNLHRANHSASALTYDAGLAKAAMTLASRCSWPFGGSPHDVSIDQGSLGPYGQNAACGESDIANTITGQWYNNEVMSYNFFGSEPPQSAFTKTGHFTQLVWKSSTKVGCATASCPNGVGNAEFPSVKSMTICNYGGPGNYAGQYAQNVMPALGHANSAANVGKVENV